jgi:CRISPR-associated protein Cas1
LSHLYLIDSNVKVGIRQGQVVVTRLDDGGERRIPFATVEGVSVFGMAQLSTRFIRECIASNVTICYYSDDGHYFGNTHSSEHINPGRQKRQVLLTDDEGFCIDWSKRIVEAKIRNSLSFLESMRGLCELSEEDTRGMRHSLDNLHYAESVDMALGFEGNAAKWYFKCLSRAVAPEEFRFDGRSSRPPKDPFNSMLSFGYSIFYRNIIGAIERHGLHPYFAFMHKVRLGHAALASDLIEDLRAPLVDRTVLDFVNAGEVGTDDFEINAAGAVYMKRDAMRRLTAKFTKVIVKGQPFFRAYGDDRSYGFQVMLDKKIDSLIEAIEKGDASLYKPFLWEPEQ